MRKMDNNQTSVLLLSTFHMGRSSDQHQLQLDLSSPERQDEIRRINKSLATFQPTHICVEVSPHYQATLDLDFQDYCRAPATHRSDFDGEILLLAYEIARQCGLTKLQGINAPLAYDYAAIQQLAAEQHNEIFLSTFQNLISELLNTSRGIAREGTLADLLHYYNSPEILDHLINLNADLLAGVNSPEAYEGADTAAIYYQRNLRIFANLQRLPLQPHDRVLIIMGGSHIAFLQQFISRSGRFQLADIFPYLDL
ncbi:MAG: DUF5694 domain-containing protein [Saprospiraceae bacterium]|nr:hypothetical protein [Lewinella sp.]